MTSFILHIQYIFKAEKNSSLYKTTEKKLSFNSDTTIKLSPHGCQVQIINWLAYPSLPMYLICF